MIRSATANDLGPLLDLLERAHSRSRYAGSTTFSRKDARELVVQCIARHRHTNYGGTLAVVSENEGEIHGVLLGFMDHVYPGIRELSASDLIFYVEPGGRFDAVPMLSALLGWARTAPKCIQVNLGVNDSISGEEWDRVCRMYRQMGLTQCGAMFRMEFSCQEVKAA